MSASVDNVRSCECACSCMEVVVEYKCPWVHKDVNPKEAFLSAEVGGLQVGKDFQLKTNAKYYYQVQMQMYVIGLLSCDFVVWTTKGIHCVEVPYNGIFMVDVLIKLEKFWLTQVVPLLMSEKMTMCPTKVILYNYVNVN